ncbi:MAG: TrkA C-terminal domain-containing protein [Firmicutes bacterium]|nr:TrkA C-terminal domain-containing protein [Bacillota bacterium]
MSLNNMILLGLVTMLIYFFFIEIFTVLFRLTGLTKSKSRFQVISLFTNSGYTTQEAELVMSNHVRRRLANTTMLFGYILNVTVISVLINIIMTLSSSASQDVWIFVLILGGFFIALFIISRIKFVDQFFQMIIKGIAIFFVYSKDMNVIEILDNYEQKSIAEVSIRNLPDILTNTPLRENGMKANFGIQVLAIKRGKMMITDVSGDEILKPNDLIVVFGKIRKIKELFLKEPQTDMEENEKAG